MKLLFNSVGRTAGVLCWVMFAAGCQQTPPRQTLAAPDATHSPALATPAPAVRQAPEAAAASSDSVEEYLDWDAVKLNGKLPLVGKTTELYKLLGKPDSIVNPDFDDVCVYYFDDKAFQYAYFKGSQAEVYGDTAVVTSIDFRCNPELELTTSTLRLNSKTTLSSFATIYPLAVRAQGEMNVYRVGKRIGVSLANSRTANDESWLLLFDKGLLVEIQWYMSC